MSTSTEIVPYIVEERQDTGLFNAKLGIWLFLASEIMLFGALFSTYIILRIGAVHWPHGSSILNVPIGTFNTLVLIASSVTMVMAWASLKMKNFAKYKLFIGLTVLLAFVFLFVKAFEYGSKFSIHYDGRPPVLFLTVISTLWHSLVGSIQNAKLLGKIIWGALFLICGWKLINIIRKDPKKIVTGAAISSFLFIVSFIILTLFEMGNRASVHHYPPSHSTFMAIYFTLTGLHGLHVIGGIIVNSYFWGPGTKMWQTDPDRFTNRIEISGLYWHFVDLVWIFLFPVLYLL